MLCPKSDKPILLFSFRYDQIKFIKKFNPVIQKLFITVRLDENG